MRHAPVDVYDPLLTSHRLDCRAPCLDPAEPVPLHHLLAAAAGTGLTPEEVGARLADLGYQVPDTGELATITDEDTRLVSKGLDRAAPWVGPDFVPQLRGHILWAAVQLKRSPADLAARYAALGYRAPDPGSLPTTVEEEDLKLAKVRLYQGAPWLDETEPSRLRGRIIWAAKELMRSPAELAARYAAIGYPGPDPKSLPDRIPVNMDVCLTSAAGQLHGDPRDDSEPVPLSHVLVVLRSLRGDRQKPQDALPMIVKAGEHLAELGYRAEFDAADVTVDDLMLISRNLDGCSPWLDQGEQVPLAHVLRCALLQRHHPDALVTRLVMLGYRCPPRGPLPGQVDEEELGLAEFTYGGELFRLEQEDPDWFRHLVGAGAHTGKPLAEIAGRLRALGFLIPEAALAPGTSDEDVPLIGKVNVAGQEPWVRPTGPVPVSHVLQAAHARGVSVSQVLSRLAELGCTRLPDLPDRPVTEDALRLISVEGDGRAPWVADTVPYGRILHAAAANGQGVGEVADRYRELGYPEVDLPAGPLPGSVSEADADLAAVRTESLPTYWLTVGEEIPLWHVLLRADTEESAPAEIGRRLGALGFHRLPASLPDTAAPGDLVLISEKCNSQAPWLDPDTTVPSEHVQEAARRLGRNPYDIAVRLVALGHTLEFTPQPGDAVIASLNPEVRFSWSSAKPSLGDVLFSARTLGRPPVEIVARLAELGYGWQALPDAGDFDDEDVLILSEGLDSHAPWIVRGATPSLLHVLRAAKATGRSPQDIAARLTGLGHAAQVPPQADVQDLGLVELAELVGPSTGSMRLEHILQLASHTGRSPAEAATRLSQLAYEVPDADYPTRRPAPTPPRRTA